MALVKLSGLISTIRGNIGGTTFYPTQYGLGMRLHGNHKRKKWYKQEVQSGVDPAVAAHECGDLETIAQNWGDLSITYKNQWDTLASSLSWTNRLGDPYTPSGYQVYVQRMMNFLGETNSLLKSAPADVHAPSGYAIGEGTSAGGFPQLKINTLGNLDEYWIVPVLFNQWPGFATAPAGPNKTPSYKEIRRNGTTLAYFVPALAGDTYDFDDFYTARYGGAPAGYSNVYLYDFISKTTGQRFMGPIVVFDFP